MSIKEIKVPDLGGSNDVDVIEVLVKPGYVIEKESPIITLESDKATMEVPSSDSGVVKEIKIKAGDKVTAGSVILTLDVKTEAAKKPEAKKETAQPEKSQDVKSASKNSVDEDDELTESAPVQTGDVHAGPAVRRIAREFGIDLSHISATGPKNRVLKEDIQNFVKTKLSQVSSGVGTGLGMPSQPHVDFSKFGPVETQSLSRIKKLSAKNLHRNWLLVPHVTQFADADITALEEFRVTQKDTLDKQGVKLTPLVFIMKACVAALKTFPQFNASLDSSGETLILKKYFHIGVAVDTPDGLVVPVIKDVDKKGLKELAKELGMVSEKARRKQLTTQDMQGGCFSISSLGGIGGTAFTPIVNVPEVAILGVSRAQYKPIYVEGNFEPRLMLPLSLSYDHRVIDGADGARFIMKLTTLLSDIRHLLL